VETDGRLFCGGRQKNRDIRVMREVVQMENDMKENTIMVIMIMRRRIKQEREEKGKEGNVNTSRKAEQNKDVGRGTCKK
jgi:hypothetical protein